MAAITGWGSMYVCVYVCVCVFLSGIGMSTLADKGLQLSSKQQHCLVHIVVSVLVSHMNRAVFTAPLVTDDA